MVYVCLSVYVHVPLDVNQSGTMLHTETCNLVCTDLLISNQKLGRPDLLHWVFGYNRKYLYVYYLCKLLTYDHHICIVDSFHISAPTDRFASGLT